MDVSAWLRELGLERYEQAFRKHEVGPDVLPKLTAEDLKEIGVVPVGDRRRLVEAINVLARESEPAPPQVGRDVFESRAKSAEAERRHLTVMFVDLVGSTALSSRLDPEDAAQVIRDYQQACADVVKRFDGHVAKYMGDGVLAYFGFPQAHEDNPERAVRAGMAVTSAVGGLASPGGEPLAARVGIATGLVVVGDLIGDEEAQERAVVGETPNLAARLQTLAEPGAVVIAESTYRLVGELFACAELGAQSLKGFTEAVAAWRVVAASTAESRFEARHAAGLTPMVGRDHEIALLLDRWAMAKEGEGQVVLLAGEAGVGKSRITQALFEALAAEPYTRLRYFGSPYHTNSALHPVIAQLERATGFHADDGADAKLDKLEAVLGRASERVSAVAPLFAALLSLPTGERYPPLNLTPQAQKTRTLEALLGQLEALAARQPVLMVLEDAHWIDPTTTELFERVMGRVQDLPVLLLVTFRPEFTPPWEGHAHTTTLTLNRLGRNQGAAVVERLTGGKALPAEVLDQILAKTDGVPLFVEELTKTVLESGLLEEQRERHVLTRPLTSLAIPATLHDSLMARLDRLGPVKEIAQIAAVIGREFSHDLLATVSSLPEPELDAGLDQLVQAELVFRHGVPPTAIYVFKHALVQDAAYQSLLKSKRKQFHAQIVRSLEQHFPSAVNSEPELLAHHYTQAELPPQAVSYWLRAGQKAAERCSDLEAVAHLTRGLELVEHLPARERAIRELDLRIALGPALMNTKGSAAPEVAAVYERAEELCREVGSPEQAFPVLWGLWFQTQTSGRLRIAGKLADELIKVAEELPDTVFQLQGRHAAWTTHCVAGKFAVAQRHVQQGLALYDPDRHPSSAFIYGGHDAGVCGYSSGALNEWALGYPDGALHSAREGVALAARLGHPFSSAQALCYKTILHQLRGEPAAVAEEVDKLLAHCVRHDLGIWASNGQILQGWTLLTNDEVEEGLRRSREALDARRTRGVTHRQAYYLALLAEGLASVGRAQEGLGAVTEALKYCNEDRRWEALAHRVHGELLLATPSKDTLAAEEALRRAIKIARRQEARSHELRPATSLARLWADQGKYAEALGLLAPIYAWFTEGFDTADLKDAKALLEELA